MQIDLVNVRKRFGDVLALDGISLGIPSGQKVALVGPNGSGKSTLVRAIVGLIRCDGIRLNGLDPFTHRIDLAGEMAYVPQAAPRISTPVGDIVSTVAALRGIRTADIRRAATRLTLDLDEVADRPVQALSGGMKQKLLIALALAAPVSLLVMDEPTASLEAGAREAFFRLFAERASDATLLLSSHRVDEIDRLVERVITIEDGRVAADAPAGSADVGEGLAGPSPSGPGAHLQEVCV